MRCAYCGHTDSKVTDSRVTETGIRRRRQCLSCGLRVTTYERIQSTSLSVSKNDNRREEFNREKLLAGIRKACTKRPVSSRTIEKIVEDIETELQHVGQADVPTSMLGTLVMERLQNVDRIAYVRYASVYRDFQDIESFERVVQDLRESNTQLALPRLTAEPEQRRQHRIRTPSQHGARNIYGEGNHRNEEGDLINEQ
jgi:transcriptional repressor NrdR